MKKSMPKKSSAIYSHKDIAAAFIEYEDLSNRLQRFQKKQDSLLLAKMLETASDGGNIRKALDKEIDVQEKESAKLRQAMLSAYTKFSEIEKTYWDRDVLLGTESCSTLKDCGAAIPKTSWKVGYGNFSNGSSESPDDLNFTSIPHIFTVNEKIEPWSDVYYASDGPILDPSRCGVMGGMGYVSGILGFGIDVTSDMCGCELIAEIGASGIVDIGEAQLGDKGVHINLSMEVAQYRGHGVPIADHGVKELHPDVGPEMYRYWSFRCIPGMEYSTTKQGMYSIPPFGNTAHICCKDVLAGDAFIVEYQFSVLSSIGCGVSLERDNSGLIVMQLPMFIRREYPVSNSPTYMTVIT